MKNTSKNKNTSNKLSLLQQEVEANKSALQATLSKIAEQKQATCATLDAKMNDLPSFLGVESIDEAYGLVASFKKHGTVFPTRKGGKKRIEDTIRESIKVDLSNGATIKQIREKYKVSNNFILKLKSEAGLVGRIAKPVAAPAPSETPAA
jgi:hypothetical protein